MRGGSGLAAIDSHSASGLATANPIPPFGALGRFTVTPVSSPSSGPGSESLAMVKSLSPTLIRANRRTRISSPSSATREAIN